MANGNCITCKNSKLDERCGEVKCLKYGHKIYRPSLMVECCGYDDKRKKKEKKDD